MDLRYTQNIKGTRILHGQYILVFGMLFFGMTHAEVLCERDNIRLATPIEVENVGEWIRPEELKRGTLEVFLSVNSHSDGWTIGRGEVVLHDGVSRYPLKTPLFEEGAANLGRLESHKALPLAFGLPEDLDRTRPLRLHIQGGIYAWSGGKDSERFCLTIWRGPRAVAVATVDAMGRMLTVDASKSTGDIAGYEFELRGAGKQATSGPRWSIRMPSVSAAEGTVTVIAKDGARHTAKFAVERTAPAVKLPGEVLVGVCIYPETELTADEIAGLEADGKKEWDGPYRKERHSPAFYIDKAVEEQLGNLIVTWPEVAKTAGWSVDQEAARIGALADQGIYSMTIYQMVDRATAAKFAKAGRDRFFLGNNMGEFASYMYQSAGSAQACKVPQAGDLEECRDWFVRDYIAQGARNYHRSYDLVLSTSGSALAAYELEGGVDVMVSELYAIGAANLAYATAEMRGAARKWKPVYWGGWLAHEWQTVGIPFQAEEKFPLLRAGLYQQFLMGSSMIVLESGSQTTQAGFYTKESGKKNFSYSQDPPTRYRAEMKDFYRYVKAHPRTAGMPETRVAVALGHCDSYVGIYIDWLPQWAQFETAKENPNWLYGAPERSWQVAQSVLFPTPAKAVGDYRNAWLAGSPLGQVDIVQIDRATVPEDLHSYRAIAYAGWNSMNERIADTLRKYVEQGGRLLICLPHLSTRLDREYRDYGVADLFGKGDLSWLLPVKVTGRKAVAGKVGFVDKVFGVPADEATAQLTGENLAQITAGEGVKTLCSDAAGAPVVVRCPAGAGEVVMLLTWEYPGNPAIAKLYAHLLNAFVASERGEVYITEKGEDKPRYDGAETSSISYAVYPDRIYLLNMDTRAPHTFDLHQGGRVRAVTLKPVEFREVGR
jgi:hypothetical protein